MNSQDYLKGARERFGISQGDDPFTVFAKLSSAMPAGRDYRNRDRIPEPVQFYADVYHWLTNQTPSTRTLSDWIGEFYYWQNEDLSVVSIIAAFGRLSDNDILVTRPGSLTNTAAALNALGDGHEEAENVLFARWRQSEVDDFQEWLEMPEQEVVTRAVYGDDLGE
jgi:hypothetical protein